MLELGLTGGIGSGKSTVAAMLVERGATLLDADAIVRELQLPGMPVLLAMAERWGDQILDDAGGLDRQAVADIVFAADVVCRCINADPERFEMYRRCFDSQWRRWNNVVAHKGKQVA